MMDTSFLHSFTSTMYLSLGYVLKLFYIYICVCVCMYVYIYKYIYIYIYIYIYMFLQLVRAARQNMHDETEV